MCSFSTVLVAFDDAVLRSWARYGLRAAGLQARELGDRAALFEALAEQPAALVIGAAFDRAPAAALLASIRTAGSALRTVVVGSGRPWARLGPVATLDGALDSRALVAAVRSLSYAYASY